MYQQQQVHSVNTPARVLHALVKTVAQDILAIRQIRNALVVETLDHFKEACFLLRFSEHIKEQSCTDLNIVHLHKHFILNTLTTQPHHHLNFFGDYHPISVYV